MEATLKAIRKTLSVSVPPEQAFKTFTEDIATWWPFRTHSIGGDKVEAVVWEGAGGRVFERSDGKEGVWGTLLVWEPPNRFVMTWHPGRGPEEATELEVRFTPRGDGTLVELEHRGWERRGRDARESYDKGWDEVLGYYVPATQAKSG